ncbi:MAG: endonuclease NucS [Staphylothermus sp.]|nr:endonuclease NucS [Staphylothermus sp.]
MIEYTKCGSNDQCVEVIKNAIRNKELLIIFGKCTVDYQGRAASKLTEGERFVIIKQDGAIIIHRPTGYSPVNWQPNTSVIEVVERDNKIVITAIRNKPREIVWVYFSEIYGVIHGKLVDLGEFVMYMDENEIRDILYENPELIEKGLRFLEKEKSIGNGYADLFGVDKNNTPVIIEIKRISASREAVLQLFNYVKIYENMTGVKPRGILIAPNFTSSAIESIHKLGLEYKEINLQLLWKYKKAKEAKHGTLLEFFQKK